MMEIRNFFSCLVPLHRIHSLEEQLLREFPENKIPLYISYIFLFRRSPRGCVLYIQTMEIWTDDRVSAILALVAGVSGL